MSDNEFKKLLITAMFCTGITYADITVNISGSVLTASSESGREGTITIVAPDNSVVTNTPFQGYFNWVPSGPDGAYRYDIRIGGEFVNGSIEVVHGSIYNNISKGVHNEN
jgi:hypothetical protein